MKLLLFDIDGTLLLTGGAGVRGMQEAGVECFGDVFSLEKVPVAGGMDPLIYAEATALAGVDNAHQHHDRFRDAYLKRLRSNLAANPDRVQLLPGIRELITQLRTHPGVILGLVTGNYTAAVPIKLAAVGLEPAWFAVTAFGDEAPDRPSLVRLAKARCEARLGRPLAPADVIVIGDTPHDVNCAHANGCVCVAVATGLFSADDLRRTGADIVLPNLADARALLDLIDEPGRRRQKRL